MEEEPFQQGWNTCISIGKKLNLDLYFTSYTKINSKWITDLNVTCKNIKLLEDI